MISSLTYDITPASVIVENGRSYYTATHNLGTKNVLVSMTSPDGDLMNGSDMFTLTDNSVTVEIPSESFTGVYTLYIYYTSDESQSLSKKRLFEQSLIDYDEIGSYGDYRIALGKPGSLTKNMTVDDFKAALADSQSLPYLSDDPSDWSFTVLEQATAQTKLNTYSKGLVDNMYSSIYPVTGVIDNVSSFTKNGTNISGTPTFNNVISPVGVSIYMSVPLTATEGSSGEKAIGSFTITGLSHFSLASNFTPYTQALVFNSNDVLVGTAGIRLGSTISSNVFTVTVYMNAGATYGNARTLQFSVDFPIYVSQINN